jgi:hypothetical protein
MGRPVLAQDLVLYRGFRLFSARQLVDVTYNGGPPQEATYTSRITCTFERDAQTPSWRCFGFARLNIPGTGRFNFLYSGAAIVSPDPTAAFRFSGSVLGGDSTFEEIVADASGDPAPEVTVERTITMNGTTTIVIGPHQATFSVPGTL